MPADVINNLIQVIHKHWLAFKPACNRSKAGQRLSYTSHDIYYCLISVKPLKGTPNGCREKYVLWQTNRDGLFTISYYIRDSRLLRWTSWRSISTTSSAHDLKAPPKFKAKSLMRPSESDGFTAHLCLAIDWSPIQDTLAWVCTLADERRSKRSLHPIHACVTWSFSGPISCRTTDLCE